MSHQHPVKTAPPNPAGTGEPCTIGHHPDSSHGGNSRHLWEITFPLNAAQQPCSRQSSHRAGFGLAGANQGAHHFVLGNLHFSMHKVLSAPRTNAEATDDDDDDDATWMLQAGFAPAPSSLLAQEQGTSLLWPRVSGCVPQQNANSFGNSSCLAWQDGYCSYIEMHLSPGSALRESKVFPFVLL